jgi:hypothetical protein
VARTIVLSRVVISLLLVVLDNADDVLLCSLVAKLNVFHVELYMKENRGRAEQN